MGFHLFIFAFVASILLAPLSAIAAPQSRDDIDTLLNESKLSGSNISASSGLSYFELDDKFDEPEILDDFEFLDEIIPRPGLEARAGHGPNNPVDAHIDCTGIEELCDSNCYAILCLNRPSLL